MITVIKEGKTPIYQEMICPYYQGVCSLNEDIVCYAQYSENCSIRLDKEEEDEEDDDIKIQE